MSGSSCYGPDPQKNGINRLISLNLLSLFLVVWFLYSIYHFLDIYDWNGAIVKLCCFMALFVSLLWLRPKASLFHSSKRFTEAELTMATVGIVILIGHSSTQSYDSTGHELRSPIARMKVINELLTDQKQAALRPLYD